MTVGWGEDGLDRGEEKGGSRGSAPGSPAGAAYSEKYSGTRPSVSTPAALQMSIRSTTLL